MTKREDLDHSGVKGMKWGVRKDRELSGRATGAARVVAGKNDANKAWMAAAASTKGVTQDAHLAEIARNQQKLADKFGPGMSPKGPPPRPAPKAESGPSSAGDKAKGERKGLSQNQKELLITAGITAAALGTLYYLGKQEQGAVYSKYTKFDPNSPIDVKSFLNNVQASKMKSWGGGEGFIQPSSFKREGFTLPAGHTFHRLSTTVEKGFNPGTYSTHNIEDFNRYVAGFRGEIAWGGTPPIHHTKFSTTTPTKVPALHEVLGTMREVLQAENAPSGSTWGAPTKLVSEKEAINAYKALSGGGWANSRSVALFSALEKKGFGAIVDEMDAGVIGESPIVMFSKAVTEKTATVMSKADIANAEANLLELANRKI